MFLIVVLLRNPVAFAKAVLIAVLGRGAYADYLGSARESGVIPEAFHQGLTYSGGSAAGRYGIAHDIARFELYRAGREHALMGNAGPYSWRKVFGPVTPGRGELHELAAVVNKMTGLISYVGLGIPPGQQAFESVLVFPRYLRCLLGVVSDAIQGGVRGNESRRLLGHLVAAAVVALVIVLSI